MQGTNEPDRPHVVRFMRLLRRRPIASSACLLLAAALTLNVAAWWHARAMITFVEGSARTPRPEDLSLLARLRVTLTGVELARPRNVRTPGDLGMAFELHRLRSADGVALEAWRIPNPAPRVIVVLAHGYASAKSSLLPEARALFELGCEPWLVDLRGSGGSSGTRTTLGWEEALDVAAAFDAARSASGRTPILYGQSMGAVAAFRAVHEGLADPAGLIVEAPFDRVRDTVRARFDAMGLPSFPAANLLVFWGGVQLGFEPSLHSGSRYSSQVVAPTLHLAGTADRRVPVAVTGAIHGSLAGPKSLELFAGAAHGPLVRADPEQWRAAVARFLELAGGS